MTVAHRAFAPPESLEDVLVEVRRRLTAGELDLPLPGHGRTAERFRAFAELGALDLSLARIGEGHLDAIAILAEAKRTARPGVYGVWAADGPGCRIQGVRTAGGFVLRGRRRFASGARGIDRALVTAHCEDGLRLFDVDVSRGDAGVHPVGGTWSAVGMEATESLDVVLEEVTVGEDDGVGGPGFYLSRPGFWHGAIGVAACWFGGALGTLRMLERRFAGPSSSTPPPTSIDEHQAAHLGAITALCATMELAIDDAARAIDADPSDAQARARTRALVVRHVVEHGCQEVLQRAGRASGTSPLVFDRVHARRAADLVVYLRQHHAERDLAALGHDTLARARASGEREAPEHQR